MNQLKTWLSDFLNFFVAKPVYIPFAGSLEPGTVVEFDEKRYVVTKIQINIPGLSVMWVRRILKPMKRAR